MTRWHCFESMNPDEVCGSEIEDPTHTRGGWQQCGWFPKVIHLKTTVIILHSTGHLHEISKEEYKSGGYDELPVFDL